MRGKLPFFDVSAAGSPPLNYQWSLNGTNIINATNSLLNLTNVQTAAAGNYTVEISSPYGTTNSAGAVLTVTPASPVIVGQSGNQTTYIGGAVNFAVEVTGAPLLNYQWSFNGTNIFGATNAVLSLLNIQPAQSGYYSVTITNYAGSTNSQSAELTIGPAPACNPAQPGLAAWWPAEGNATDIVSGVSGTVYPGTSYAAGMVGQAFSFDGVQGCVMNTGTPPLTNIQNTFTIEFWAYPQKGYNMLPQNSNYLGTSGQSYAIFPDWGGNDGQAGVGVCVGTNGISVMEHAAGYLPSLLNYTNAISGWVHVAIVYNNKHPSLYVNGVYAGTGITSPRTFVYPSKNLGGSYDVEAGFSFAQYGLYQGYLDEISIYNRALSADEITAIYNAGSGGKCRDVMPVPGPTIGAASVTGSQLQLNWALATGTFQVQTATSLAGPWTIVSLPLTTNGANVSVTVTTTNQQQYYRLVGR